MKRTEFLSTLGIGLAAACTGCLAACSKDEPTQGGATPVPAPTGVNFNMDLNNDIKSVGESKTTNGVIVVRLAATNVEASFTAVQVACPHQGVAIEYKAAQGQFFCSGHGSIFTNAGVVTTGPAVTNLKKYTVAIAGNTLNVTG